MTDNGGLATRADGHERARSVGRAMVAIGVAGLVLAIVVGAVAYRLAGDLGDDLDTSLAISEQALAQVDDSVAVAAATVTSVGDAVRTAEGTLAEAATATTDVQQLLDTTSSLAGNEVPDGVDRISDAIAPLVTGSERLEETLGALRLVGVEPPQLGFVAGLVDIASDLDTLASDLRTGSRQLGDVGDAVTGFEDDLEALATDVAALGDALGDAEVVLAGYTSTADDARVLVAGVRDGLDGRRRTARLLVLTIALVAALGQAVPLWLGRRLASGYDLVASTTTASASRPSPAASSDAAP